MMIALLLALLAQPIAPAVGPMPPSTLFRAPEWVQPGSGSRAPFINIRAAPYLCAGDGVVDDTACLQAALNTGKDVLCPAGSTFAITNSLYMNTWLQQFYGDCSITMDSSLAKPALWLGASDATGTDDGTGVLNAKVRGIRFIGTGTPALGSSGIALMRVTTTEIASVRSWGFYAGIDVRGYSIANTFIAPDLRLNTIGFYDRAASGQVCTNCSTFEGSAVFGGRIEANTNEGVNIGSKGVSFTRTVIEGNSSSGALPQVRIRKGFDTGPVSFVNVYFENAAGNTSTSIILVEDPNCGEVELIGTQVNGNTGNAANLYIIDTASTCTTQGYTISGGRFSNFKNYLHGAILNNSVAMVAPTWADASRDVTADLTASAGAIIWQFDRTLGLKTGSVLSAGGITGTSLTSTAAAAATALQLTTNALINFGGTATLKGDGSQLIANGNVFAGGSGNSTVHAGVLVRDDTANSLTLKGTMPNTAGNVGVKITNTTTFTDAATKIACFSPDNAATFPACVDLKGGLIQTGVTFANIATGSTANGTVQYCSDCTIANPCAGGGTGALAKRLNGAWVCN